MNHQSQEVVRRCIGKVQYPRLTASKLGQLLDFVRLRGMEWKYVPKEGIVFEGDGTISYYLGIGEVWRVERRIEFSNSACRRAVLRVVHSDDLVMSEVVGGMDTVIGRFGHLTMVKYVHRSTEQWNRLKKILADRRRANGIID